LEQIRSVWTIEIVEVLGVETVVRDEAAREGFLFRNRRRITHVAALRSPELVELLARGFIIENRAIEDQQALLLRTISIGAATRCEVGAASSFLTPHLQIQVRLRTFAVGRYAGRWWVTKVCADIGISGESIDLFAGRWVAGYDALLDEGAKPWVILVRAEAFWATRALIAIIDAGLDGVRVARVGRRPEVLKCAEAGSRIAYSGAFITEKTGIALEYLILNAFVGVEVAFGECALIRVLRAVVSACAAVRHLPIDTAAIWIASDKRLTGVQNFAVGIDRQVCAPRLKMPVLRIAYVIRAVDAVVGAKVVHQLKAAGFLLIIAPRRCARGSLGTRKDARHTHVVILPLDTLAGRAKGGLTALVAWELAAVLNWSS